jgi:hypothetical protein
MIWLGVLVKENLRGFVFDAREDGAYAKLH